MHRYILYLLFTCLSFFLPGCSPGDVAVSPTLLSASQLIFYPNASLRKIASTNDSLVYKPADYEVGVYRISYRTSLADGTPVTASGIVYVPSQLTAAERPYPLLSYQHSTAFSSAEAPSGATFPSPTLSYPLYFATNGYIVACPDYVGYGASEQIPHEYEYHQALAQATVDMLLATKEFLAKKGLVWSEQVFMAGYSEGGYATLSAQKMLEEKYASQLHLAGSSCGAGPYAMSDFFSYLTQQTTPGGVANYIYVWETLCYNQIYGLQKPISYYFKSPYAEQISKSLDNTRMMTVSFDKICTDQFRADVRDQSSPFRQALNDNDLTNWTAQTPTQLIHSEQDEIIPFLTTQQTYNALRQRGSSRLNLVALKNGFHLPTEIQFATQSMKWFAQLRK